MVPPIVGVPFAEASQLLDAFLAVLEAVSSHDSRDASPPHTRNTRYTGRERFSEPAMRDRSAAWCPNPAAASAGRALVGCVEPGQKTAPSWSLD